CCGMVAFFFQAEDGIRDRNVTVVQTCALPIFIERCWTSPIIGLALPRGNFGYFSRISAIVVTQYSGVGLLLSLQILEYSDFISRSEERRVGKELTTTWSTETSKE